MGTYTDDQGMTQTPEHALAAAHVAAVDEMEPLRDLAAACRP